MPVSQLKGLPKGSTIPVDYDAVYNAAMDCVSDREMAEQCGIPRKTWFRRKLDDKKFQEAYNLGREAYVQDYKDEIFDLFRQACGNNGHAAYLIFAMKNLFGWSDNKVAIPTEPNQVVNILVDEIDNKTKALVKAYKQSKA
jgi:hypothetical protein